MEKFRFERFGKLAKRFIKWGVRLAIVVAVAVVLSLLVMLAISTSNSAALNRQFEILVLLNGVLIVVLLLAVITLGYRLYRQVRRKQFGAKLTTRFALVFAVMAIVPGVLIYLLSIQYMTRSLESWFNVKVDSALQSGLTLGQTSLDALVSDITLRASQAADEMKDLPEDRLIDQLSRLRETNPLITDTLVFSSSPVQRVIGASSTNPNFNFGSLMPQLPSNVLYQLRWSRQYSQVEMLSAQDPDNTQYRLRVIVPVSLRSCQGNSYMNGNMDACWLQVTGYVPDNMAQNLNEVQHGFKDYEELAISRSGLQDMFIFTLTLALLFTVLVSLVVALWLARRMVQPLLSLAEGTQAVAVGDYRPLPEDPRAKDEIAQLTRSFNVMTRQLDEARRLVNANRLELERNHVFLESVLSSLTAGVIVFDERFNVMVYNRGAREILRCDLSQVINHPLSEIRELTNFSQKIKQAFSTHSLGESTKAYWQEQIELQQEEDPLVESLDHDVVLLVRGLRLDVDNGFAGYLLVFDDVSDVIAANRAVAWGEVARRLAHEIKNPLTPIQLSAERLAMKLSKKLEVPEAEFLQKCTDTIVNQVASLKRMVDDFREYAKTPPAQMKLTSLNELIVDLAVLYGWDSRRSYTTEPAWQRLDLQLEPEVPMIQADPDQLRQVINNLLSNARDAMSNMDLEDGAAGVKIITRSIFNEEKELQGVRLIVEDRGPGFSSKVIQSAFEPYVTTKAHGTGLGLAIVRKIIDEHGGLIEISNIPEGGARVSILFRHFVNSHQA